MSLNYFDDPKKQAAWNKEINQIRQEKARRTGKPILQTNEQTTELRRQISYEQLLEREYGAPKPQQLSRSTAMQMEKSLEMGGMKQ